MSTPIDKTLEEIRTELYQKMQELQGESIFPVKLNLNRGLIRGMIELVAWALYQVYALLSIVLKDAFPSDAEGWFLEKHCAQVGITRKLKTKTKGLVRYCLITNGVSSDCRIYRYKTILKTLPDYKGQVFSFLVDEATVIPHDETESLVNVTAELPGREYNVFDGQITQLHSAIPGITSVINKRDVVNDRPWITSEGTDDEDDESLFQRYQWQWKSGGGLAKYSYASWAMSVPGVSDVFINDNHPNNQASIHIYIRGENGTPTQDTLDNVVKKIELEKPQLDKPEVFSVNVFEIDINATLVLREGDPSTVMAEVNYRLKELNNLKTAENFVHPLRIGQGLSMDTLVAAAKVKEVEKIEWISPVADRSRTMGELVQLRSVNLAFRWYNE